MNAGKGLSKDLAFCFPKQSKSSFDIKTCNKATVKSRARHKKKALAHWETLKGDLWIPAGNFPNGVTRLAFQRLSATPDFVKYCRNNIIRNQALSLVFQSAYTRPVPSNLSAAVDWTVIAIALIWGEDRIQEIMADQAISR